MLNLPDILAIRKAFAGNLSNREPCSVGIFIDKY